MNQLINLLLYITIVRYIAINNGCNTIGGTSEWGPARGNYTKIVGTKAEQLLRKKSFDALNGKKNWQNCTKIRHSVHNLWPLI
jgi:hypothetical protein